MKKKAYAVLSALLCAVMVFGILPTCTMAEVNVRYQSDFNTAEKQDAISSGNIGISDGMSNPIDYPSGLGGRGADDYSMRQTANNQKAAFNLTQKGWINVANIASKVTTFEFSMLYGGDAESVAFSTKMKHHPSNNNLRVSVVKVAEIRKDGSVYIFDNVDTGVKCGKDEWLRVAFELHSDSTNTASKIYINGKLIENAQFTGYDYTRVVEWGQVQTEFTAGGSSCYVALDDVKMYDDVYTPTGTETVSSSVANTSDMSYDDKTGIIYANENVTVAEVLNAVTTDNTVEFRQSVNDPSTAKAADSTEKAANGSGVIIKSADGKTLDIIRVSTEGYDPTVHYNPMPDGTTFSKAGDTTYTTRGAQSGLYTKAAEDTSYCIAANNIPASTKVETRDCFMDLKYTNENSSLMDSESFTAEFSIAGSGDFDSASFITRTYINDTSTKQYINHITFDNKSGRITRNNNGPAVDVRSFNKNEWYRVAFTVYPKECKYDLYLNGEKLLNKAWLANDPNWQSEENNVAGFEWFQISALYGEDSAANSRSGMIAIDDVLLYYGEYLDKEENGTLFSSEVYRVDENLGVIYVDGSVEIDAFGGNINYNEASVPVIYTDDTYTAEAERITAGAVAVVTSPNGFVKKYYTVMPVAESMDEAISCFVNGAAGSKFSAADDVISASVNVYAPEYAKKHGALILAVYRDGRLCDLRLDEKDVVCYTKFSADYKIGETEGVTAKAMFLDLSNIKPLLSSVNFERTAQN